MWGLFRERRRERLRDQPVPEAWEAILSGHVPFDAGLPEQDRRELRAHLHVLLDEKAFEGCGGFEVDDTVRLTILAQAALLLLRRRTGYFSRLRSILVYPESYVAPSERPDENGLVSSGHDHRLGESWSSGSVVLAWDATVDGARRPDDGRNVVLHEFAHQLDQESGSANGAPVFCRDLSGGERRDAYRRWAEVMEQAFERLRAKVASGRRTLLDPYGATNPAEFFAVATECFFEQGALMKRKLPDLYEQLQSYYRQDPASWSPPR